MNRTVVGQLRALLALSRVSHLPTIWSNCLAGWWLGGQGNYAKLPLLFLGVSALYTGGMFLNDAFDADFDRQRRTERPIPSGTISRAAVWGWGLVGLGVGALCLPAVGKTTGVLTAVLLLCIIIYDATHKVITASPWLMGVCRFWVYVIAGSAGAAGVNGEPIWCGVALAGYVGGLGYLAQHESSRGRAPYWPLVMLLVPVGFAMVINTAEYRFPALWLSHALVLWIAMRARTIFQATEANVGHIVSGLLAGIVLVDWLAVAPWCQQWPWLNLVFLALFSATLALQRFVPTA
jgi:4-hydroxybenzoate polyprenyltransferase